jgi:uncharacterized protein
LRYQEATVSLTIQGVWNATKGDADSVQQEGFPGSAGHAESFVKNGGKIWACTACANPRGITVVDLIDGATIGTVANVVDYTAEGAST